MATVPLSEFIGVYRDELLRRCIEKAAARSARSPSTKTHDGRGLALFMDQLANELRHGQSETREISKGAADHGRDLLLRGFTVSQVVHDYGDVCQAITDLAVEMDAPIDTKDFRTMNRCLDDAIASAVTEHARGQLADGRDGEFDELRFLTDAAIIAFEVLQDGRVGVAGATGGVLLRTLTGLRALADRQKVKAAQLT
jgi:hypothetical protein